MIIYLLRYLYFAFRQSRSVQNAASLVLHTVLEQPEGRNIHVKLLFIDFSSAFNAIMPTKLGLDHSICASVYDFLSGSPLQFWPHVHQKKSYILMHPFTLCRIVIWVNVTVVLNTINTSCLRRGQCCDHGEIISMWQLTVRLNLKHWWWGQKLLNTQTVLFWQEHINHL